MAAGSSESRAAARPSTSEASANGSDHWRDRGANSFGAGVVLTVVLLGLGWKRCFQPVRRSLRDAIRLVAAVLRRDFSVLAGLHALRRRQVAAGSAPQRGRRGNRA